VNHGKFVSIPNAQDKAGTSGTKDMVQNNRFEALMVNDEDN
jgi:hypothetical protein